MALTKLNNRSGITASSLGALTSVDTGDLPAGSVVQVVHYNEKVNVVGTGNFDCFSANITPTSTSNKIIITVHFQFSQEDSGGGEYGFILKRNGSEIVTNSQTYGLLVPGIAVDNHGWQHEWRNYFRSAEAEDTPNTTSQVTYTLAKKQVSSTCNVRVGQCGYVSSGSENMWGQSMMTLTEIKA